jgi:hypothetical protein
VFLAHLAVSRADEGAAGFSQGRLEDRSGYAVASWRHKTHRVVLALRTSGKKPLEVQEQEGFSLSGKLGVVRLDKSKKPERWLLVEGESFSAASRKLVTASAKTTVSVVLAPNGAVRIGLGPGKKGTGVSLAAREGVARSTARFRAQGSRDWVRIDVKSADKQLRLEHPGCPGEVVLEGKGGG